MFKFAVNRYGKTVHIDNYRTREAAHADKPFTDTNHIGLKLTPVITDEKECHFWVVSGCTNSTGGGPMRPEHFITQKMFERIFNSKEEFWVKYRRFPGPKYKHAWPKPDFLGRYKEEDVRQFLDDAAGRFIVTKRLAVTPAEKIRRLESEKAEIEEKLAEYEKILASPAKMRSRAAFLEFRKEVSASIECKYGIKGSLNYRGIIKDTPLSLFTLTVSSLRHIIVTTPDGEAFRYAHVPALGAKGMVRVASNAVHGTYETGKGLIAHISNVARIAQILYPDNNRVRGNSWSGKSALSEEQRRQLRELERSGAANASFEDTTYVEFLG